MEKILQSWLRFWAKRYLKRTNPKIVAITGSVGKTSTKEAIFEVLKIKYRDRVRKSWGNLNNETGLPMAILDYEISPQKPWQWLPIVFGSITRSFRLGPIDILVLEMAADKPGDIKYLTEIAKPFISVITSIGPAHLEAFGTVEKIVQEKADLIRVLPLDGWAVLNIDDERVKKLAFGGRWQVKTYGIKGDAEIKAQNILSEIKDYKALTKFQIKNKDFKINVDCPTLGENWNILAALAAASVGQIFELDSKEIALGVKNIKAAKHRMEIVKGQNDSTIVDDSYNANPVSMKAALDVLKKLPAKRKIVILGDMLELGKIENEAHKIIGRYAKEVANECVGIGKLAKKYNFRYYYNTWEKSSDFILSKIRPGDIILIKGSRKIGLENLVEKLKL